MNDMLTRVKVKRGTPRREGIQSPERELNQDPRRLRRRRLAAGMSQAELAAKAGCSFPYVCQLENGKYSASGPMLAKLATALGCEITEIMTPETNGVAA